MDILQSIERHALAVRDAPPIGEVMLVAETAASITLAMERPLYRPALKMRLNPVQLLAGAEDIDAGALFGQFVIDKARLSRNVRLALQTTSQITLHALLTSYPLEQGLAELVSYLQLAADDPKSLIDESTYDVLVWRALDGSGKQVRLPSVIFVR